MFGSESQITASKCLYRISTETANSKFTQLLSSLSLPNQLLWFSAGFPITQSPELKLRGPPFGFLLPPSAHTSSHAIMLILETENLHPYLCLSRATTFLHVCHLPPGFLTQPPDMSSCLSLVSCHYIFYKVARVILRHKPDGVTH